MGLAPIVKHKNLEPDQVNAVGNLLRKIRDGIFYFSMAFLFGQDKSIIYPLFTDGRNFHGQQNKFILNATPGSNK